MEIHFCCLWTLFYSCSEAIAPSKNGLLPVKTKPYPLLKTQKHLVSFRFLHFK